MTGTISFQPYTSEQLVFGYFSGVLLQIHKFIQRRQSHVASEFL